MSRSFRESYMGRRFQAVRGFYLGKKREAAKSGRYRLQNLFDEEGMPELPRNVGKRWIQNGGKSWGYLKKGHKEFEIIMRNRRKFMRQRRHGLPAQ